MVPKNGRGESSEADKGVVSEQDPEKRNAPVDPEKPYTAAVLCGVCGLALFLRWLAFTGAGEWDARAVWWAVEGSLKVPFSALFRVPLFSLFLIRLMAGVGRAPFLVWCLPLFFSVARVLLGYAIARRLFKDQRTALLTAAWCAFSPLDTTAATHLSGAGAAGFFSAAAVWILTYSDGGKPKGTIFFLGGAGFGLAAGSGPWGWVLMPWAAWWVTRRTGRSHARAFIPAAAGFAAALLLVYGTARFLSGHTPPSLPSLSSAPSWNVPPLADLLLAAAGGSAVLLYRDSVGRSILSWLVVPLLTAMVLEAAGLGKILSSLGTASLIVPAALLAARAYTLTLGRLRPSRRIAWIAAFLMVWIPAWMVEWNLAGAAMESRTARLRHIPAIASFLNSGETVPVYADAGTFPYLSFLLPFRIRHLDPHIGLPPAETRRAYLVRSCEEEPDRPCSPSRPPTSQHVQLMRAYRKGRACAFLFYAGKDAVLPSPLFETTGFEQVQVANVIVGALPPMYLNALLPELSGRCVLESFLGPAVNGELLELNGKAYLYGLRMQSNSAVSYRLEGRFKAFECRVGLDDREHRRSKIVYFAVFGDDQLLHRTPWIRPGDPPRRIHVNIEGVQVLKLAVVNRGDVLQTPYADWAVPCLYR